MFIRKQMHARMRTQDLNTDDSRRALLSGTYEEERRLYDGIVCRGEFEGTEERGH